MLTSSYDKEATQFSRSRALLSGLDRDQVPITLLERYLRYLLNYKFLPETLTDKRNNWV